MANGMTPQSGGNLKDSSATASMNAAPSVVAKPGPVDTSVPASNLSGAVAMVSKMNERGAAAPSVGGYKIDGNTH